jgi:uncharacterized membrane protein
MRVEPNENTVWRVAMDSVLDWESGALVRPFLFIVCAAVATAIVTTGGEIALPPAVTMQVGAALTVWVLLTVVVKNSLVWLSLRWTRKADAAKAETDEKPTRFDQALAYMHRQPTVIRHAVFAPFAALIALAILTDGRFATGHYWRADASVLTALNDLAPVILALTFTLFVVDGVQSQFARHASMRKRAAMHAAHVLDEHLSPEIEQQVRTWAQREGISFSLAVEHLLALGVAEMHLKQFTDEMLWDPSFPEPDLANQWGEVWRWI